MALTKDMKYRFAFVLWILIVIFVAGCTTVPLKPVEVVKPKPPDRIIGLIRIPPAQIPSLADDLDRESLEIAIDRSLQYYGRITDKRTFRFGSERYTLQDMKDSLLSFLEILRSPDETEVKEKRIREQFDFYKASGREGGRKVLFTGYFEPVLDGALEWSETYKYPIYSIPEDMISIDLGKFKPKYKGEKLVGRISERELVPYYNRKDIEKNGSLGKRGLEIAWLSDPIDLFFLHIQGSGVVRLPDGKTLQVGYAEWNGRPYRSIGRHLLDSGKITQSELSHRSIKRYLREHPDEMDDILNHNESYIFFRIVEGGPIGSLGVTVTGGRTIATDPEFFPRGALSLIRLRKPVFDQAGEIVSWTEFSRFTLNQDTGGVIKGPGRVDIFCGRGEAAEQVAGSFKEEGDLYFLVKKKVPPKPDRT